MAEVVIACYRPKPGKDGELRRLIGTHVPVLRAEGLVTERTPCVMRAADGTYVEIFEWRSAAAVDAAHINSAVQKLWAQFAEACDYETIGNLKEAQQMFAHFQPVEL